MTIFAPVHVTHRPRRNRVLQLVVDAFTPRTVALTVPDVLAPAMSDPASPPGLTRALPKPTHSVQWLRYRSHPKIRHIPRSDTLRHSNERQE